MTCERCRPLLDDYVDGVLAAGDVSVVEAHLVECDACRVLAADLSSIRRVSGELERRVPPPQVWTRLSAALESERPERRWFAAGLPWRPLTAAATLMLMTAGGAWLALRMMPEPQMDDRPVATATDPGRMQSVEAKLKAAEQQYEEAITELEQVVKTDSAALNPQVKAVLQKNLGVIDEAIGESRAALQSQPTNLFAQESLFEALRSKVALLQETIVLINEMRKGDPEGTARAVSGLNQ